MGNKCSGKKDPTHDQRESLHEIEKKPKRKSDKNKMPVNSTAADEEPERIPIATEESE